MMTEMVKMMVIMEIISMMMTEMMKMMTIMEIISMMMMTMVAVLVVRMVLMENTMLKKKGGGWRKRY